ncbi:TonB-dependent receptor [Seonamhaeicola sp. MEBiC1930]|uniref:TonB-dependent receptor n=1 Tax=Seonamhaeicola sp. MEBiC01930 TaxID=2976768 RepID=UPI00324AA18C
MNRFFTFFLLSVVSLFSTTTFSQNNISGHVKDENNNALKDVIISFIDSNLNTNTNSNGAFYLENVANGNYVISISHLGYKSITQNISIEKDLSLSFVLEEDLLNLETIIVTGTFDPRTSLESTTSVSILNNKTIQQTLPQGTASLLQNIPGTFTDASAGEVFTKVYTRGISASAEDDTGWYYTSLQEDGLPVSLVQYSYYGPDLFHRVDLTTKKVEALRGGSSSITTLNAPGGIYNFISNGRRNQFGGDIQFTSNPTENNNSLYKIDANFGGPLGKHWFFNTGGHYRQDNGARNNDFSFSQGGQFKFNIIKEYTGGYLKFYGKLLNDKTNRYNGVAATNWDNPTPAFNQDFNTTSLLMPSFNGNIPDGRNLNSTVSFNPAQGVHAKDIAFGVDFSIDLGNQWNLQNNAKFSAKKANWQTSISNTFESLNGFLPYYLVSNGNPFPAGQIIFRDAESGSELARINNAPIFSGEPIEYLTDSRLPNDAIMGTSAWYKDTTADEFMDRLVLNKQTDNHNISVGLDLGISNTSLYTQGSFAFTTYEPNPRMLQVTLENPGSPAMELSDENGLSNYGGLFFVNTEAKVDQISTFINDKWKVSDQLHIDLGLRHESITHKGSKDRFAPFTQNGGLDGNENTAYDNNILKPTGEKDPFNYSYHYLSFSGGINYRINSNSAVFTRLSKGNKAPELNYYFDNFSNVPINKKGEVQKIVQAEIGIKYNLKNISFTSTAFWSQLKDIGIANFEFDESSGSVFYTPILFNTSRTIGLEWESIYTPFLNLVFRFNGILQNPKATGWNIYDAAGSVDTTDDSIVDYSGSTLPFNPKCMFNFNTEFAKDNFSVFLKWQYMGKRFGNVANGFELSAYSIFNFGTGYKINKHITTNILVTNLFNSEGLANFFGANNFGANANGATPEFIAANPDASFVVVPVLPRRAIIQLKYSL